MSREELLFVRPASGLSKMIGKWTVIFFALAPSLMTWQWTALAMLPSWYPGVNIAITYGLGGIFIICEGISSALLMLAMPRSGGNYIVVSRGIHPFFGTMEMWRAAITNAMASGASTYIWSTGIGSSFKTIGTIIKAPAIATIGDFILASPANTVAVGLLIFTIGFILAVFGPRIEAKWYASWGVIGVIAMIFTIGLMLSTPHPSLQVKWDALWGEGAYNEILTVAKDAGYETVPFSWTSTALSIVFPVTLAFPYCVIPYAGEVAEPSKNIPLSAIGSAVILALLYAGASAAYNYSYAEFSTMYNFIIAKGLGGQLKLNPVFPLTHIGVFAGALTTNPILAILTCFGPFWTSIGEVTMAQAWTARSLFSGAMDRFAPEIFSRTSRWGTPIYAILFWYILTWIFAIPGLFGQAITAMISLLITYAFIRWQWSWVATVLPFHRPEIYRGSVRKQPEIAGLPVISIFGIILFVIFAYLMFTWCAITPLVSRVFVACLYGFGAAWYIGYAYKCRKEGIDIARIFGTLPPE